MRTRVKGVLRERDDEVLAWVQLRSAGWSLSRIARAYHTTSGPVQVATDKVMKADLAESGEPRHEVRARYW